MIRQWVKLEHFVGSTLHATEAFDYQERLYDPETISALLVHAGLHTITMMKAYALDQQPTAADGLVIACRT